ncbi:MAG: PAS domain S-box protein [Anaerolineae bacterium]|nr:PAS domain S-box protein [Anaerolineae bacterium]
MFITTRLMALKRLLERLTRPSSQIQEEERRYRARLLAALLVALLTFSVVIMPIWVLTSREFVAALPIAIGITVTFIVVYGLSRTRRYELGALILIYSIPVLVIATLITAPGLIIARMLALKYLLVAVVISNLFFRGKLTLLLVGLSLAIIGIFFFLPDVPFAFAYSYLVFFVIISSLGAVSAVLNRRYRRQLAESEQRYRSAISAISEGIVLLARDGSIQACNAAAERILGLTADQMIGRTTLDIRWSAIHEDGSPFEDAMHPANLTLKTGQPSFETTMGIHRPDGELRWISINAQPLTHPGEMLAYAVVISFTDITQRKKNAQALREAEHRYHALFEQAHDAVFILDLKGNHLEVNRRAAELLGYTMEELQQLSFKELSTEIDKSVQIHERLLAGEHIPVFDRNFRKKDGTQIPVEINVELVRDLDGRPIHIQSVVRDITERKQKERQLRLQSAALEAADNAIMITDRKGLIEWSNPAYTRLTGYTPEEIYGKNPRESVKSGKHDSAFYRTMWNTMLSGKIWRGQVINRRKDGSIYTEEQTITPVKDETGSITHFVAIKQDITERQQAELALRESEARYRSMFEDNRAVKLLIDPETGFIMDANSAAAEFYGYPLDTLRSMRIHDINILSEPAVTQEIEHVRNGQERVFYFQHRLASGEVRDVEVFSGPVIIKEKEALFSIILDVTARKQAEEALRQNEERQRSVLHNMGDIVWSIELPQNRMRYLNPAVERISGRAAADFDEDDNLWLKCIHPDDVECVRDFQRLVLQQGSQEREYRIVRPDGSIRWILDRAWAVKDQAGMPVRLEGIASDITDRKQVETLQTTFLEDMRALQRLHLELSEIENLDALYLNMVEMTRQRLGVDRIGLFVLDHGGTRLHGTYGIAPDGTIRDEHYYQETITADHWTMNILNARNHVRFWENEAIYDNGKQVGTGWKAATALWNGHNTLGYLVMDNFVKHRPARLHETELVSVLGSIFGHLIARKQAEEVLRQNEARQRALLSAIPDMVFRNHRDGTYLDYHAVNPSELLVPPEQFLGRNIKEVLPSNIAEHHLELAEQIWQTGEEQKYEYALPINGQVVSYEARMVIAGEDEVLTIIRNITERQKARQREIELMLERERTQLLTQFIQNAAHEFRTPLSVINTNTFLMALLDEPEKRRDKASTIDKQVRRMAKLVDMLLKMATLQSAVALPRMPVDLDMIIKATCGEMMSSYGENPPLRYEKQTELSAVMGDLDDLVEVFVQLLDNAYRFTPPEGSITITARQEDGNIRVVICDTGSGISEANLAHIFETFWRRDEVHTTPGFGLGLPIAQKIIEIHDGSIEVESEVGKGSTFSVILPAWQKDTP